MTIPRQRLCRGKESEAVAQTDRHLDVVCLLALHVAVVEHIHIADLVCEGLMGNECKDVLAVFDRTMPNLTPYVLPVTIKAMEEMNCRSGKS